MKKYYVLLTVFLTCFVALFLKSFLVNIKAIEPYSDNTKPGKVVVVQMDTIHNGNVLRTVSCYPDEIYYGDTVYFTVSLQNLSEIFKWLIYVESDFVWVRNKNIKIRATSPNVSGSYEWIPEDPCGGKPYYYLCETSGPPPLFFSAGKKESFFKFKVEFCPLQDYEHEFWKELREKMTPDGVVCTIHVDYEDEHVGALSFSQNILVRPRPQNEMTLLEKWYRNTPKELFPGVDEQLVPYHGAGRLLPSGRSNIIISSLDFDGRYNLSFEEYSPWCFIRVGNRKPSDPNNPRTIPGWRKLESSLVPSTMRDEITRTRFRLERCDNVSKYRHIEREYKQWLQSLPEVQRKTMTESNYYTLYRPADFDEGRRVSSFHFFLKSCFEW